MMTNSPNQCYLDANFLVAVFIPQHIFHQPSVVALANLLLVKKDLFISPLCMDEAWHKARLTLQQQVPKQQKRPHSDFYSDLKHILDEISKNSRMKFVQFGSSVDQGIAQALENIKDYNLGPRDAFHMAIMQDLGISEIVTKDRDFARNSAIQVIPY
jgi:predicted nucleic acid-binding protein